VAILAALCTPAFAQTARGGSRTAIPVITEKIDDTRQVTLRGNVRPEATPDRDLGPVEDGLQLRLYLVLQRSPESQAALDNLIERQQQPTAAEYHQWITPQQFGERFGVAEQDIAKLTAWLESRGMKVSGVMNNASFIDFTASAGNVRDTFGTQLHYFNVRGKHPALVSDPRVPEAIAGVVAGIQGLNKLPPIPSHTKVRQTAWDAATHSWHSVDPAGHPAAHPEYSTGNEFNVTPQDFYTIYNVNPLFTGGTKGAGATVAVIEESDIVYGTVNASTGVATGGDVATFRKLFGVPGTLNMHVYHGYGSVTCNDPGIDPNGSGEESEAALDAEWASALAPSSNLIFMSCDQNIDQGTETSEMALIDNNISDVMSLSYGWSEENFAASDYTSQDTLYAQAATQGQTFIVSAGDSGADAKDQDTTGTSTSGINVSGYSASPLVTTAGGTDFQDLYDSQLGGVPQSNYWGANNSAYYADALGYVPETSWNDSCASSIEANYQGYSGADYCALGPASVQDLDGFVVGGSGGFSTHYAVPSYQSGITGYSGTKRAQPDISSFAANGWWNHSLISCDSHVATTACTSPSTFGGSGGTSFVAPQFAGITGLLVTYTGTRQGLLNPTLYALAKKQFTAAATESACYSTGTTSNAGITIGLPASSCIFNDVTSSNNDEPCAAGSTNCYVDSGAGYGMLSLDNATALKVSYPSTVGYDEVSGIGTLNVTNLFTNWNKAYTSTTTLSASAATITSSQSTNITATVKGGTPAGFSGKAPEVIGTVSFSTAGKSLGSCTLGSAGTCLLAVSGASLVSGANSITATFAGSKEYPASTSSALTVTVSGSSSGTPVAVLFPTGLTFGSVTDSTTSPAQSVKVSNTGTGTLDITSIQTEGGAGALGFVVSPGTCGTTLAAGANCSFAVVFKPGSIPGVYVATVGVTDNAAGSPQGVTLTGTGVAASSGGLSVTPASLSFGSENVGATSPGQVITIKNNGTAAVTFNSISHSFGADPTSFEQLSTCYSSVAYVSLAAGASCTTLINFVPKTIGTLSADFSVESGGVYTDIPLTGTGIATAALTMSPSSVAFGATTAGGYSAASILTVTNTGTTTADFGYIGIGGTGYASFYQVNSCGTSLAVGARCYVYIVFEPAAAGSYTATMQFFDNAQNEYQGVALSGTGK
jgi:subtilase family serine protease